MAKARSSKVKGKSAQDILSEFRELLLIDQRKLRSTRRLIRKKQSRNVLRKLFG